jgi:RNA polymerase sigma factor (sigma-70 family)
VTKTAVREQVLIEAVKDNRSRVLSIINRMTRDQGEAEEIFQDVFAEFMEAYDLGVAIETVGAWMVRVAQNKVLDRFRRKKTQNKYQVLMHELGESEEAPDSEEWLIRNWLRAELINALETLSPEQREVFVQNELEGKSFEEIASATGTNINTLLSRKRAAVLALREYLKETYDEL